MKRYRSFWALCLVVIFSASCQNSAARLTSNNFPLQQAWVYSSGAFVFNIVANDRWVAVDTAEGIVALDAVTGEILWSNPVIPGTDPGNMYIVEERLAVIDTTQTVKVFTVGGDEVFSLPLSSNQKPENPEIVGVSEKYLSLISRASWVLKTYDYPGGTLLWQSPVSRGGADIFIDENIGAMIIVDATRIRVLELETGATIWEMRGEFGTSAYMPGILFFYEDRDDIEENYLVAFDVKELSEIWRLSYSSTFGISRTPFYRDINRLSLYQNMLFVSSERGVFAIDANMGNYLWKFSPDDVFATPIQGLGDALYARGSTSRKIYALTLQGALEGSLDTGSRVILAQTHDDLVKEIYVTQDSVILNIGKNVYAYK